MTLPISLTQHAIARLDPHHPTALDLQHQLLARGYWIGRAGPDGVFGNETLRAFLRFQTHWGPAACGYDARTGPDGICGTRSWDVLSRPVPTHEIGSAEHAVQVFRARVEGSDGHPRMRYVYAWEIALASTRYPLKGDCSEGVQFSVYQATQAEGHADAWVDGSVYQYLACRNAGRELSVPEAIRRPGSLLFIASDPRDPWTIHHVTMSVGDSTHDVECRSSHLDPSCGVYPTDWARRGLPTTALTRRFTHAGFPPVLR